MLKKVLIGIGIIIFLAAILFGTAFFLVKPDKNRIVDFINENPDRSAIKLVRNDTLIAEINQDKMMPLASTVKIIIAIEYATQAAEQKINPDKKVDLVQLNKYYVPNTDGGAHEQWLASVQDKIENEKISIREIAKGMIKFSSNANTEWLMAKLGLDQINNRLDSLGVKKHSEIYYIVSALFVSKEQFPELSSLDLVKNLKALSQQEYIQSTYDIHSKLAADTTYKKGLGDLPMGTQRIWSDNLPSSTVSEYVNIMKKINSRSYFNAATQKYLDEVMEFILDNPANREWLEHSGMKGGSTAFILTKSLYATDKEGNKTELAYFFNDLGTFERVQLQMSMNEFELNILRGGKFTNQLKGILN